MKPRMYVVALLGALALPGCTSHLSDQDKALLESATTAASQAQQSAAAAAQSASQAAQSASSAAQSAAAAQQSEQQVEAIFKKMQHK